MALTNNTALTPSGTILLTARYMGYLFSPRPEI